MHLTRTLRVVAVAGMLSVCTGAQALALPATTAVPSDVPVGVCDTIARGSLGYRNLTGRTPNAYEKIGVSVEKRGIFAEHWGPMTGRQVLVVGQTHGDECAPAFLVEQLRLRDPVGYGIWLIPTLNPDGLVRHTRRNANGVDLNRDGFTKTQPETRALLNFTKRVKPVLTVHLHSPYAWVGSHNGPLAFRVADKLSRAVGWGYPSNSGENEKYAEAFLWQGQAKVLPGHQTVLIEFPALSKREAATAPQPHRTKYASVADVRRLAVSFRTALDQALTAK
jgi:protein MpaA